MSHRHYPILPMPTSVKLRQTDATGQHSVLFPSIHLLPCHIYVYIYTYIYLYDVEQC